MDLLLCAPYVIILGIFQNNHRKAAHILINYFRKIGIRRFVITTTGNIFLGLGISIFKLSGLGSDPFSSMVMALSDLTRITYTTFLLMVNATPFICEAATGRKLIGVGTLVSVFLLEYIVTFFYNTLLRVMGTPQQMIQRVITVLSGVVITSLGVSLYQYPNVGVVPYDSISLILVHKKPHMPYSRYRANTGAFCALICYLAGEIIGLGTLLSAFGLESIVQFFNVYVSARLPDRERL